MIVSGRAYRLLLKAGVAAMAAATLSAGAVLHLSGGSDHRRQVDSVHRSPSATSSASSASPSATPTTTATASPTAPSTKPPTTSPTASKPGSVTPPSGFPNATNTGYRNAPGFPGSLTKFSGTLQSNQTYKFFEFPDGLSIPEKLSNITFIGCRFTSNDIDDATVPIYGNNIAFQYSSFEPIGPDVPARTVAYNAGYQYAIDQRRDARITVDHSDFWGWANAIQFAYSSQDKPVIVRDSWFHHSRDDGGQDHTDAILESYGGPSHMVFDHNTIVAVGNTNGLALQGDGYSNVTITRNYFSGFGYTVSAGLSGRNNKNVVFMANTFGTDIKPEYGPLYGWEDGSGNVWRQNKWRVTPGGYSTTTADDGKYWWPDGTLSERDYNR